MKRVVKKKKKPAVIERITEDYEVRAFRDEGEESGVLEQVSPEIPRAEPGAFQAIKVMIMGYGEQTLVPDDCQFGDNDLCFAES